MNFYKGQKVQTANGIAGKVVRIEQTYYDQYPVRVKLDGFHTVQEYTKDGYWSCGARTMPEMDIKGVK